MSKKQLNEFFVALGVGDQAKAKAILETVVKQKLANKINENSPDFPTREFNGISVNREQSTDDVDQSTVGDSDAGKWQLIADYLAAKQVIALGHYGEDRGQLEQLEGQVEQLRDQLAELEDDSLETAETIADIMAVGELDELENQVDVPEGFREQLDAAIAKLSGEGDNLDDTELDDTFDDEDSADVSIEDEQLVDEDDDIDSQSEDGMRGLGKRFGAVDQDEQITDDRDTTNEYDFETDVGAGDLRAYIEDCILNSDMDIDECYNAVRTQFGDQYTDEEIDQTYHDVIDQLPELN